VETGDEVSLHYDSLLAKLIVWAADREQAINRMSQALQELVIAGVVNNQAFHRRLMADSAFRQGEIDIQFLERRSDLLSVAGTTDGVHDLAVAAALAEEEARLRRRPLVAAETSSASPWVRQARSEGLR
jgi:acetyl/propionyl-CoA carboxylase alpha subunit